MAIAVEAVEKRYVARGRETVALAPIDIAIASGEFVAFVGPSGCGKSTLLNMVAGILPPTAGRIVHDGQVVDGINTRVGYMTQADSVLPWRTVAENIELPLRFRGLAAGERRARTAAIISRVGLAGFEAAYPIELSGGMRKRVALAQLLVYEPGTLLMDEPFGALDAQLKLLMQRQLMEIFQAARQTIVFVTHDLAEAITLASRVFVFSGRPGRIKAIEAIELAYPRDPFRVRFQPEFEAAYARLWDQLAPEIAKGEAV